MLKQQTAWGEFCHAAYSAKFVDDAYIMASINTVMRAFCESYGRPVRLTIEPIEAVPQHSPKPQEDNRDYHKLWEEAVAKRFEEVQKNLVGALRSAERIEQLEVALALERAKCAVLEGILKNDIPDKHYHP